MGRQSSVFRAVVLGSLVLVAFATAGIARECPEFAGHMPGNVSVVEVSGDLAYFGNGAELVIADVTDSSAPRVVGWVGLPDSVATISVLGDFAYVGTSSAFHVIDVSTPSAPVNVLEHEAPGSIHDLAVEGDFAYVVAGGGFSGGTRIKGSLQVIDVSDPFIPRVMAFLEAIWWMPQGVAVANGYAYVADSDLGLRVFDVSSPSAPVQVGTHAMPRGAAAVTVSDDYIYVVDAAANSGELCVMDVSTPSTPVEVGVLETSGDVLGVQVSNGYAYLPEGGAGVRVVDVRVPSAPVQAGFIDTPGEGLGVAVADDRAYIADGREGLRVVDVREPSAPAAAGRVDAIVARGVAAANSFAYVANSDGFAVIDMSSPSAPAKVGFLDLDVWSVAAYGNYAYALGDGLHVIDVSWPSMPVEVGVLELGGFSIAAWGDFAYIIGADGCLHVIDVSTPSAPLEVGSFCGDYWGPPGFEVSGDHLYLLGGSVLHIIDVSNPSVPFEVGSFSEVPCGPYGGSWGVAVSGGFAFVASWITEYWFGGPRPTLLSVIDVRNPAEPEGVAVLDVGIVGYPEASNVTVFGDLALVWSDEGLHVIDVSIPSAPVEVRSLASPGVPHDLARSGDYVYAATGDAEMYMLDTRGCRRPYQNPDQPTAEVE